MRSSNFRSHHEHGRPSPPGGRPARRAGASSGPNYALRRIVAATLAIAVLLAIGSVALSLAGLGSQPAVASETGSAAAYVARSHLAQPGDTLWSIAAEHRAATDIVSYVDRLIDLNGGTRIDIGQAVL
ncbi:MAG: LysM domain-containing protein, partial [Actinomycetota bacterium]